MNALANPSTAADPAAAPVQAWPAEQSFSTQLSFALERPGVPTGLRPSAGTADLAAAERIAGTYTVSYNAASGLLALSGTLNVDGATYFVDDQLTIDREASFEAYLSAHSGGEPATERRLTAWSVSGLPEDGPGLKLLAGLAVMSHLGLQRGS
ncbi:hypothetical protein [Aquabacterium sp.]|uniref:hypothetical protein n=1 Tax=Aquabacterium sp. TaxID=1872578 RepID=UPI002B5ECE59|nr:hypothetical protein [Aquabacterium sp.]HSW05289.1 hypothetical protein [Aquabacterium sp.]